MFCQLCSTKKLTDVKTGTGSFRYETGEPPPPLVEQVIERARLSMLRCCGWRGIASPSQKAAFRTRRIEPNGRCAARPCPTLNDRPSSIPVKAAVHARIYRRETVHGEAQYGSSRSRQLARTRPTIASAARALCSLGDFPQAHRPKSDYTDHWDRPAPLGRRRRR